MLSPKPATTPRQPQVITMRHLFQILLAFLATWTLIAGILVAFVGGGATGPRCCAMRSRRAPFCACVQRQ